ncbi:MAG TPA: tRNA dihydrouridine synthase DusB [Mycobacteriales bacterium]|jgi:nifR3 family TIM-barrel protein|nr:tRNA dihydrouridine synthase DusB [Mycobacteriales bacterium]
MTTLTGTPLRIGPLVVDPPVVLAPMAGVTDAAYRALCRSYGAGLYVSEMVSARALVEEDLNSARRISCSADETVRSIQLYGVDPVTVGAAVRLLVEQEGVHHVDLNMGCPSPKVTRRGGGAALPVRAALVGAIVEAAVAAAGEVPVTVKMRKGVDDAHLTYLAAGRAARDAGAAAVALHARTAEQLYSGLADRDAIRTLKQALPDVPVLGNGDIWEAADALAMQAETGCDGVVVGRGCLGRPWLFRDLADAFAGRPVAPPPLLGQVVEVMKEHVRLLVEHRQSERYGTRDFRKHVGWYLTGYPVGGVKRRQLSEVASIAQVDALLDELDPATALPPAAVRMPRGHTYGPKTVSLPQGWLASGDDRTVPEGADVWTSGG